MATNDDNGQDIPITLEKATIWARSNHDWDKVYRYLFLHPKDFFAISPPHRWPIGHQVVFHGDVDLLKRILALLSHEQIDIRSKSADNKTLLDVATEKQKRYPLMFTYIQHLFAQDELIEEAKNNNWNLVEQLLEKNPQLANEKPPYSPYFLLHYIVEYGNAEVLQNLRQRFQFLTNVLNITNETPLDMAIRLNKYAICSILRPITVVRPTLVKSQPETPPPEHLHRSDERSTYHSPMKLSDQAVQYQQPASMPDLETKRIDPKTQLPVLGFGGIVVDITENGDFTVGSSTLFNSTFNPPMPPSSQQQPQQPQSPSGTGQIRTKKSIVSEYPLTNFDPPSPPLPQPVAPAAPSSNEQLKRNLTCTLTQEIFTDPVIASDGQTYERSAILDWVNTYHCSPTTGALMDATFHDNTEIKNMIQSIKRQS